MGGGGGVAGEGLAAGVMRTAAAQGRFGATLRDNEYHAAKWGSLSSAAVFVSLSLRACASHSFYVCLPSSLSLPPPQCLPFSLALSVAGLSLFSFAHFFSSMLPSLPYPLTRPSVLSALEVWVRIPVPPKCEEQEAGAQRQKDRERKREYKQRDKQEWQWGRDTRPKAASGWVWDFVQDCC